MTLDPEQVSGGFTIIPKTSSNQGLNFLDKSAEQYVSCLMSELKEQNFKFDKPIAFLLNPPYKNTDENEELRDAVEAAYTIDDSILELTGNDAGKERYLAFLGQIINISRVQVGDLHSTVLNFEDIHLPPPLDMSKVETPLILIFTPTSWLIPRPTYVEFRKVFDKYFKYEMGFIVLGNEFFKIQGRFPIAFTIWSYRRKEQRTSANIIVVKDLTFLKRADLEVVNWNDDLASLRAKLHKIFKSAKDVNFSATKELIKNWVGQQMYDFKRDPTDKEKKGAAVYGGLPLKDPRRKNKKTYGITDSKFVGFMDDNTPVRVRQDNAGRMSVKCDRVWLRLDNDLKSGNKTRAHSGPTDKYSYCAYDLISAQKLFVWFGITKALNGVYPVWANQFDIWKPSIPPEKEDAFYSLCFSFALGENSCVVTNFEKDNPIAGALEVFVDNPLCPTNPDSFWSTTLANRILGNPKIALELTQMVQQLYQVWNQEYCKGQFLYSVGLQSEPYFRYFAYKDFLTPYSGLSQIKKYAELHNKADLLDYLERISGKVKAVREEIRRFLVQELSYFEK